MNSKIETQQSSRSERSLWPLGIMAFFSVAIVGAATFVIFCNVQGTDLVSPDYYEQELKYQARMEKMRRASELPVAASVVYEPVQQSITISLPTTQSESAPVGHIHLYRPSASALDRRFDLRMDSQGRQQLDGSSLKPGPWKVEVEWTAGGAEYLLEERIVVGARPS